ncbi:hypothetical protein Xcel_3188 [Xylanimonas cellulosilytica DSM 15894]|uniref:Uncharacterized protein n=1 Tax=Xylanimonas cellulosilytica (strain DSM 15894 / JCM 12276 / CECT 5975 / KCTC 9989 / LMG 20990 / NBRC 107835 / XIL07) TaxID=446471 RepID=D1C0I5_XYLCX|nr:hypothetical protein [Xylanimonas cellulosilytica]ACZ32188.1 hypothetical protein Xcel_3188 [Xylanimonas cellulosilytica DSM 15894]
MAQPATYPTLPRSVTRAHEARHLLALPGDVVVDEVEVLALSRFTATRWEVVPRDMPGADVPVGRMAGPGEPGVLRLSRHSSLTGPYAPAGQGFDAGLPSGTATVFDVVCPRERWAEPAPTDGGDKDGIARAFPAGLPNREEERVVSWLVATARRLGGSVRLDVGGAWDDAAGPHAAGTGVVLTPDPGAAVNLTVYSDVWLDPQACHRVIQAVHPRAHLATEGSPYQGPPAGIAERPLYPGEQLDADLRRALHAAADDFDIAALQEPHVLDGFGVTIDLGLDGWVTVEVAGEDTVPLLLRELPWVRSGCVAYRVVWDPPDLVDANREVPPHTHLVARKRSSELVARVSRALWDAAGGEIADESDFLVDPEDL